MTISRSRKRQRSAVEQAAGAKFLPGAGVAGHHPEQHQRRRAAHDAVELLPESPVDKAARSGAMRGAVCDIGWLLCYNKRSNTLQYL